MTWQHVAGWGMIAGALGTALVIIAHEAACWLADRLEARRIDREHYADLHHVHICDSPKDWAEEHWVS